MKSIPFSDKFITLYFETEDDSCYEVNYETSKLKNDSFINYIYNVNIPTAVYVNPDLPYEDRSEIMLAWLNSRNLIPIDSFSNTLLSIILKTRQQDNTNISSFFNDEETKRFIKENQSVLELIVCFLDSILFHVQVMFDLKKQSDCNYLYDRDNAIPKNTVNIFQLQDFFILYYRKLTYKPIWFKQQFEGKNALVKYFYINKNIITSLTKCILKEKINPDNFVNLIKRIEELNEKI